MGLIFQSFKAHLLSGGIAQVAALIIRDWSLAWVKKEEELLEKEAKSRVTKEIADVIGTSKDKKDY